MDRNTGFQSHLWRSLSVAWLIYSSLLVTSAISAAERVPWTASRIQGSAEPPKPYRLEPAFPELQFRNPVELVTLPGSNLMLLLQVDGKVFLFEDDFACKQAVQVHDIAAQFEGFGRSFSIQPHPDFEENGFVFVCYAHKEVAKPDGSRISRFRLDLEQTATGLSGRMTEETVLLTWAS
ncbi:MAG: PQQ-dependent sugar dehydrogenase, partial [Planctomycetota bacterium]